jgi:hypothetical protein
MPLHATLGLFAQHKAGPLCKGFFTDLKEAKQQAQQLANRDGCEYFIFSFVHFIEVARVFPPDSAELKQPSVA